MKEQPEVLIFLLALRDSLYGDLENFDRLCNEAEKKEKGLKVDSDKIESHELDYITPITTTPQTTSLGKYLLSVDSKQKTLPRSTIPHTLALFSLIDLVGFLLGDLEANKSEIEKNLTQFFKYYDEQNHNNFKHQGVFSKLAIIYRNGMAHSFFPRRSFGISAESINPNELFFQEDGIEVLNVKFLIKITKEIFEKVITDSSIIPNLKRQYERLESYDKFKTRDII